MRHVSITHGCVLGMLKSQHTFPKVILGRVCSNRRGGKDMLHGCLCWNFIFTTKIRTGENWLLSWCLSYTIKAKLRVNTVWQNLRESSSSPFQGEKHEMVSGCIREKVVSLQGSLGAQGSTLDTFRRKPSTVDPLRCLPQTTSAHWRQKRKFHQPLSSTQHRT